MTVCELLSDESKWCKEAMARDANGEETVEWGEDACQWCLSGAVGKCYSRIPNADVQDVFRRLKSAIIAEGTNVPIEIWNDADSTSFADIRRVIEKAGI